MREGVRSALVVVCVLVLVSAGSATTYGLFSDSEQASGTIQAADKFNGNSDSGSSSGTAYNDADGDGERDMNEQTYSQSDLVGFDNPSANLVIPESVGPVEKTDNGNIQMTAQSITSEVKIRTKNGGITLTADGGNIDLAGPVVAETGSIDINAQSGDVNLEGATIDSKNRYIDVTAGGHLNMDRATIDTNAQITLRSGSDIRLENAEISSKNGEASATLGSAGDTLYVNGATIGDKDDTLRYSPADATVDGTPNSGTTQPN
ncbi:hypothetical protein C475_11214 [Halosimplex carlsbadense 2-9-1]|uniref:Uncharacterized protein n=1 Tax=Halosimplex carlsbadense 2-9-1 TaxID=797114 RepID=M0CRU7_9EURY|nr:SipW-dependent-type signal peptide-containing protein [Halosimplex carlsbadense]ELZ25112.1 hypothetical protein C475_11214 [Halosimplex carlsbadense 2-9-1]